MGHPYDKIWDEHVVHTERRHRRALHRPPPGARVASPQTFEGLRETGPPGLAHESIVATADHNTPTTGWDWATTASPTHISKGTDHHAGQEHCLRGRRAFFPFMHKRQGIVHVIGPENGATLPGMTVVCGDSHTSTHGAFGALAHGIGTSEVEHVMAADPAGQKAKTCWSRSKAAWHPA